MSGCLKRVALFSLKNKNVLTVNIVTRQKSDITELNVVKSNYKKLEKNNDTVPEFVFKNLDRWPDKTATVCAITGRGYTYAQVHKFSKLFGASLRSKLKLETNDNVTIVLPNMPEYPIVVLGTMEAGCVTSLMNPIYTSDELERQLKLTESKLIIASKLSYANIKSALEKLQKNTPIVILDNDSIPEGTIRFSELITDPHVDLSVLKSVHRKPDDIATIPFSSGTTGFPKGVVLTNKNIVTLNQMISDPSVIAIEETTATHQAVFPAILPFFHIFGFNALMMNQMHLGCKLVTLPYFKPDLFLQTLVQYKCNVLFIVPPMLVFLGKHPGVTPEHLKHITATVSGAASCSKEDAFALLAKNPNIKFRQGYGLTETSGAATLARSDDKNYSSVGYTLADCEAKIVDIKTNEALPAGQEGELWCRGPNITAGYFKDEAATKEVLTEDGWYKTGDIAKYDEKNYFYITDRLKELIKVKGFQVPPAELEAVIRAHPKIADCAVIGVPDPITGEAPKAFLVAQPGQTINPQEILEFVNPKLAKFKSIKEVQIIDSIPKNAAGKILRKDLKKL